MARRRRKTRWWRVAALAAAASGLAALWLAAQAERKLSTLVLGGLGEGFSTRIWSAPFRLETGARALPEPILTRLERLRYRRVDGEPARGEYRWSPPELAVFLRGHNAPGWRQEEGLRVLRLGPDGAWSLFDASGAPAPELRLEPELVAELSGARSERREPAAWEQLPPTLRDAVVATEDKRFWSHHGLDPRAILRAALGNVAGRELQGASTITQQLSKNLFLTPRRTLGRKATEAALALYLEARLGKQRILTLYLNHIYLGQDGPASVMGARAAARHYFSKDVSELTLPESAMIAGLIRSPGAYNPFRDPLKALARRNHALRRMREEGMISQAELEAAASAPLGTARGASTEDRGESAYYAAEVVRQLLPRYDEESLFRHGLSIHTAMDPLLQGLAARTLRGAKHQAALAVVDPEEGAVLALAGGRDFRESQFNRATQAARQPGSAFKPFVYAAALEAGVTPATTLSDKRRTYPGAGKGWSPDNYGGVYLGTATVRRALALSLNAATLDLAQRAGLRRVEDTARACGIASPLRRDLGLALGASEVGLLELTAAYAPFANGGLAAKPRLVLAVVDADGAVLESAPPELSRALSPGAAFLMTSLLQGVAREGTARGLKTLGADFPAAGKTGTTNDGKDAWFVGFTSSLLAGVWVGDDKNRALRLTGAKDALPLWAAFMKEAVADRPALEFARPESVVEVVVCEDSGLRARAGCPRRRAETFISGTEPTADCDLHRAGVGGWLKRLFRR